MIYLASPYSHEDKIVEEARYHAAMAACASYAANGHHVYSPIVHWHVVASQYEMPTDAKHWHEHNMHMLSKADELHVLRIDGYKQSKGLKAEFEEAKRIGIPILATHKTCTNVCNDIVRKMTKHPI